MPAMLRERSPGRVDDEGPTASTGLGTSGPGRPSTGYASMGTDSEKSSPNGDGKNTAESSPSRRQKQTHTAKSLFFDHLQATVTYCSVFWSFGMCVALLGPTLLDLGCQTGSSVASMSFAFLSQSLSTLIGSMIGGLLSDRLVYYQIHSCLLFGKGAHQECSFSLIWCPHLFLCFTCLTGRPCKYPFHNFRAKPLSLKGRP